MPTKTVKDLQTSLGRAMALLNYIIDYQQEDPRGVDTFDGRTMESFRDEFRDGMLADVSATMTDLDICRDLMKNHANAGVRQRCMFIELRLVQNQDVDPQVLQEMRDIHAGGDVPA